MWRMIGLLVVLLLIATPAIAGTVTIDILDVGQGDAILIRTPASKVVLIDAGEAPRDALQHLKALGVSHIDLAVATHAHADHIGGMTAVVEALPVKVFTDNGLPHTTATYRRLMTTVENRGVTYRTAVAGTVYRLDDGATLEVLFPKGTSLRGTRSDLNSNSVVLRLRHHQNCFLFTGDSEEPTERALLDGFDLQSCDVLKVAHHGSVHSTSPSFLERVKPRIALISAGLGNTYGHPGLEVLDRLQAVGASVYRTDLDGTVTLRSSEAGIEVVKAGKQPRPPTLIELDASPLQPTHLHAGAGGEASCPFVASQRSRVFHEATCGNAQRIKAENRRCYPSTKAATAAGKRTAGCCRP
jgi:beta-lactamase superfamily II metal-dependent hydrolase